MTSKDVEEARKRLEETRAELVVAEATLLGALKEYVKERPLTAYVQDIIAQRRR